MSELHTNIHEIHTNSHTAQGVRKVKLALLGPAFIAAIGYIDPGNFVTNIQTGASYGYKLLWVVVWSNIMGVLVQLMSAKLGIATGKNLAEHIRDRFSPLSVWLYWIQAEIIAMATDLAEFIGASLGFKLLLGIPLFLGGIITGIITFLILFLQKYGQKPLEFLIGGLLIFVAGSYVVELFFSHPQFNKLIVGATLPSLPTFHAAFCAAGVLGATIMPHVIYLHSALTQNGDSKNKAQRYSSTKLDVALAMTAAGFVNLAMMIMSAAVFNFHGHTDIVNLDDAYLTLKPLLSHASATIFGLSLVAAGLSSTVVGTLAGQVVMQGFINFNIPLWVRRSITMLPSLFVLWIGYSPSRVLVVSQVILSFGIAFALIPLLSFTSDVELMGKDMVNSKLMKNMGRIILVSVITLNAYLLVW